MATSSSDAMCRQRSYSDQAPVVVIFGIGHIGSLHKKILIELGYRVLSVDPCAKGADFKSSDEIPTDVCNDAILWIIAVPTMHHLSLFAAIAGRVPMANILIEKPLCSQGQLTVFRELINEHRGKVIINAPYRSSAAVRLLADRIAGIPIEAIRIDFSKNRYSDQQKGRFVDNSLGLFGYEWAHMLYILEMLLPTAFLQPYFDARAETAETHYRCKHGSITSYGERFALENGTAIQLASSISGEITLPPPTALLRAIPVSVARQLSSNRLPEHSKYRWRVVQIVATGREFWLCFHPFSYHDERPGDPNVHVLLEINKGEVLDASVFVDNHLEARLREAVGALEQIYCDVIGPIDFIVQTKLEQLAERAKYFECGK